MQTGHPFRGMDLWLRFLIVGCWLSFPFGCLSFVGAGRMSHAALALVFPLSFSIKLPYQNKEEEKKLFKLLVYVPFPLVEFL